VQLEKHANECSFFLFEQQRRCKVTFEDGAFLLPETGERITTAALQQRLAEQPQDFSANVALRCIVQQELLRPLAYVAGPGEIAYWGQFKQLFSRHRLPMPVVYPRAQAVLTTLKLNKLRERYGLALGDLKAGADELVGRVMLSNGSNDALLTLREHKQRCLEEAAHLLAALERQQAGPTLMGMAGSFLEQTRQNLDRLELTAAHEDTRQVETVRQQVQRLCTALAPERKPQERIYSIFSFLFEHGWDLIPRLLEAVDHQRRDAQEVEL
jgi:bacillithiol synthase